MTRLFLARDEERVVWVMALIDGDVWTYVANTGKFHRNEALRDDYLAGAIFTYEEVGVTAARRAVDADAGLLDEETRAVPLRAWRADQHPMDPDVVFASMVADLG
jgi:hypothetical protein